MRTRLKTTFSFVNTQEEAQLMCDNIQARQNSYRKKYHKPHYTPWSSQDQKEHKFVVWYCY